MTRRADADHGQVAGKYGLRYVKTKKGKPTGKDGTPLTGEALKRKHEYDKMARKLGKTLRHTALHCTALHCAAVD